MSHLLSDKALCSMWVVMHSAVKIRQFPRLHRYLVRERRELLPKFYDRLAMRQATDKRDAVILNTLYDFLPAEMSRRNDLLRNRFRNQTLLTDGAVEEKTARVTLQ